MTRIILINPNTNAATTDMMCGVAREAAPAGVRIDGITARHGAALITDAVSLSVAAEAVLALAEVIMRDPPAGVIISAFGDPGLIALRNLLPCPVTGLAEAAMGEAAADGRAFAVVTTTPGLVGAIESAACGYGHGAAMRGVALTGGDIHAVMGDPKRLEAALEAACRRAIADLGAEAIVIGGGPLAIAARALAGRFDLPIIAPIPAAIRLALSRAAQKRPLAR